jgi:hypothetical protein
MDKRIRFEFLFVRMDFRDDEHVLTYIRKLYYGFEYIAEKATMLPIAKLFEWWCMQIRCYDEISNFPFDLLEQVTYKNRDGDSFTLNDKNDEHFNLRQICWCLTEELYLTKRGQGFSEVEAFKYSIGFVTAELWKSYERS